MMKVKAEKISLSEEIKTFLEKIKRSGIFSTKFIFDGDVICFDEEGELSFISTLYLLTGGDNIELLPSVKRYEKLDALKSFLSNRELEILINEAANIVDSLLPYEWTDDFFESIAVSELEIAENDLVYIPYSKQASFSEKIPNCNVEGFEENEIDWLYGMIKLHLKGIKGHWLRRGGISSVFQTKAKYDKIFLNLPTKALADEKKDMTLLVSAVTGLSHLNENGKLVCLLYAEYLYNPKFEKVWNALRTFTTLEKVITFENTPLHSSALLVFAGKPTKYVRFMNIATIANQDDWLDSSVAYNAISKAGNSYTYEISHTDIIAKNLTYRPLKNIYNLPKLDENSEYVSLRELVENVKKNEVKGDYDKLIEHENLFKKFELKKVSPKPRKRLHVYNSFVRKIEGPSILLSWKEGELRVGKVEEPECVINRNIHAFKLRDILKDKIREDYLIKELSSEYVYKQLEINSYDWSCHIRKEAILNLQIAVPKTIENQQELVLTEIKKQLSKAKDKLQAQFDKYQQDVHMRKHCIGQVLSPLYACRSKLRSAIENAERYQGGQLSLESMVSKYSSQNFKEVFNQLDKYIDVLGTMVDSFTFEDNKEFDQIEDIDICEFFKSYVENNQSPDYLLKLDVAEDLKGDKIIVCFSKMALETVVRNTIHNAWSHGLKDSEKARKIIKIKLNYFDKPYIVSISNNGNPINSRANKSQIFDYGYTTQRGEDGHSGLGCYQSKLLMIKNDLGDIRLGETSNKEFPVNFELLFNDVKFVNQKNEKDGQ